MSKYKKQYSSSEKKSWKRGFFAGLFKGKVKKKSMSKPKATVKSKSSYKSKKPMKEYGFLAFNDNCDVFNVHAKGTSRSDALRRAKKHLKRDPERPFWGVEITNDDMDSNFYRHVTVEDNGSIFDNWRSHYRAEDEETRRKYKDLSKPVTK